MNVNKKSNFRIVRTYLFTYKCTVFKFILFFKRFYLDGKTLCNLVLVSLINFFLVQFYGFRSRIQISKVKIKITPEF